MDQNTVRELVRNYKDLTKKIEQYLGFNSRQRLDVWLSIAKRQKDVPQDIVDCVRSSIHLRRQCSRAYLACLPDYKRHDYFIKVLGKILHMWTGRRKQTDTDATCIATTATEDTSAVSREQTDADATCTATEDTSAVSQEQTDADEMGEPEWDYDYLGDLFDLLERISGIVEFQRKQWALVESGELDVVSASTSNYDILPPYRPAYASLVGQVSIYRDRWDVAGVDALMTRELLKPYGLSCADGPYHDITATGIAQISTHRPCGSEDLFKRRWVVRLLEYALHDPKCPSTPFIVDLRAHLDGEPTVSTFVLKVGIIMFEIAGTIFWKDGFKTTMRAQQILQDTYIKCLGSARFCGELRVENKDSFKKQIENLYTGKDDLDPWSLGHHFAILCDLLVRFYCETALTVGEGGRIHRFIYYLDSLRICAKTTGLGGCLDNAYMSISNVVYRGDVPQTIESLNVRWRATSNMSTKILRRRVIRYLKDPTKSLLHLLVKSEYQLSEAQNCLDGVSREDYILTLSRLVEKLSDQLSCSINGLKLDNAAEHVLFALAKFQKRHFPWPIIKSESMDFPEINQSVATEGLTLARTVFKQVFVDDGRADSRLPAPRFLQLPPGPKDETDVPGYMNGQLDSLVGTDPERPFLLRLVFDYAHDDRLIGCIW